MFGIRTYAPTTHDFFDEVATLLVNLGSFNTTTEAFTHYVTTIPTTPEHSLSLYGRVVHASFQVHGLLHTVVRNAWPSEITLTFTPGAVPAFPSPSGVQLQSNEAANLVTQLVGTAFLKYYERNAHRPKRAYSGNQKVWPELWRFAWLLRNAIAHGDRWSINDPSLASTSWHGVQVAASHSGEPWLNVQRSIGGGDVLLLLEELNASPI